MLLKNLVILASLFLASPAWSLVEVKMTYTSLNNKSPKEKVYTGSGAPPSVEAMSGIGGDLIFTLPIVGLGIGMRYENLGFKYGDDIVFDGAATRTAAILGWRWVDTLVYFGPIFSYGFSHSGGQIKATEGATIISDLTADKQSSYSAGLELGGKFLGFRVGAEAGYLNYEWKNLTGTSGSITSVGKLDMSGPYVKLAIGFGI